MFAGVILWEVPHFFVTKGWRVIPPKKKVGAMVALAATDVYLPRLLYEGSLVYKKETILLDALILSVINSKAFSAELRNGHRFTAFIRPEDNQFVELGRGDKIWVEMSSYDMSKGQLVTNQD